jgi:protein subunit release factor A
MQLMIEIRAAEGGEDAKLLVAEQARVYQNYARLSGVALTIVDAGKG